MSKYLCLFLVYLFAVSSGSISSALHIDVQTLYRVPLLGLRWIDIAILWVVLTSIYSLFNTPNGFKNTGFIIFLCALYLVFESFQFGRTIGKMEINTQFSLFICTLSLFTVIDLARRPIPIAKTIAFIKQISVFGAVVITFVNGYLLFSFFTGRVVYEDLDVRVAIEVIGSKETVYSFVLTPLVYAIGLYYVQKPGKIWLKIIFIVAILSIYGALIITFWRGTLIMVFVITLYFIISSGSAKQTFVKFAALLIFVCSGYLVFGEALASRGYDPVEKIMETVEFTADVDNPQWDKGRKAAQDYALNEWKDNVWFGAGYIDVGQGKLKAVDSINPHNGIVTSLFHRGILGTFILLLIFLTLFGYGINCWLMLRGNKTDEAEVVKLLVLVSLFWVITFMTQEALWEKYSLSIEFLYLAITLNIYKQLSK